jgi:hypothetical protein
VSRECLVNIRRTSGKHQENIRTTSGEYQVNIRRASGKYQANISSASVWLGKNSMHAGWMLTVSANLQQYTKSIDEFPSRGLPGKTLKLISNPACGNMSTAKWFLIFPEGNGLQVR